jgi:hypothetical protein
MSILDALGGAAFLAASLALIVASRRRCSEVRVMAGARWPWSARR